MIDSNHDRMLDINEIGNSLAAFYPGSETNGSEEGKYWGAVSRSHWIPKTVLEDQIRELGDFSVRQAQAIVGDINLENNPNVTFWQFLRSKDLPGGK